MAYNEGASSGNLVLIQSQTASNSASINFTTGITAYHNAVLVFENVTVQTNSTALNLLLSTDGGSTYIVTGYQSATNIGQYNVALSSFSNSNTTSSLYLCSNCSNSAGDFVTGKIELFGLNSSTSVTAFGNESQFFGGDLYLGAIAGSSSATSVNAIRVIMSSGNIVSGTFKLYGVQN